MQQELHEADYAANALNLLEYAKEQNLEVEVFMTYSLIIREHPEYTLAEAMSHALQAWDI